VGTAIATGRNACRKIESGRHGLSIVNKANVPSRIANIEAGEDSVAVAADREAETTATTADDDPSEMKSDIRIATGSRSVSPNQNSDQRRTSNQCPWNPHKPNPLHRRSASSRHRSRPR
jgi:hypothetical protein